MKIISTLLLFFSICLNAQFTSPGTGVTYTLTSLSTAAPTVLVNNGTSYTMTANVMISAGDTLLMDENTTLIMNSGVKLTVAGTYNTTATSLLIQSPNTTSIFNGIQFDSGSTVNMVNTTLEYGGGIRVSTANFTMNNCIVRYFKAGLVTGSAIQLTNGSPIIQNSQFLENDQPAIASGATNSVSATISNNYIFKNSKAANNRPQLNMGPGGNDSLKILNNTIIGDRTITVNGGIGNSGLLGLNKVRIQGNTIRDNRYGITVNGGNSSGIIKNNIIEFNDTETDPMNGGSGIALYGTGNILITGNQIRNNLWGVTLISNALANLGDDSMPGNNIFYNNGNGGNIYALYNNTANPVQAKFNCWRENELSTDPMVEAVIGHQVDNSALGLVAFSPYNCALTLGTNESQIQKMSSLYPNPNDGNFFLNVENAGNIIVNDASGRLIHSQTVIKGKNEIKIKANSGVYFLTFQSQGNKANFKFIIK